MNQKLPKIAKLGSYPAQVEAGKKYSWCSCGLSANQPFCDGAHKAYKNPDGSSVMKSVAYVAEENKIVYFCGCKNSKNGVLCDGSHSQIKDE